MAKGDDASRQPKDPQARLERTLKDLERGQEVLLAELTRLKKTLSELRQQQQKRRR
jgi:hypothetical protein